MRQAPKKHPQRAAWNILPLRINLEHRPLLRYFFKVLNWQLFSIIQPTTFFPKPFNTSSAPLQLSLLQLSLFASLFVFFNRLSRKWWIPVGERWRYIGNSSAYCALCLICLWTNSHYSSWLNKTRREQKTLKGQTERATDKTLTVNRPTGLKDLGRREMSNLF